MAGHSKWAQIKHQKAKNDAKRGQIFTKLIREITVAARLGGGDPDLNPRLRLAIEKAKEHNMPKDNIEKAIKKGTGELEGVNYIEATFEGYGPGGVALLIETVTDNKNRTTGEIRHIFSKYGGNLGSPGSVAWQFEQKGIIQIDKDKIDEETLLEIVLDAGAQDITTEVDYYEVSTTPHDFIKVKSALEEKKIPIKFADVLMVPKNTVSVSEKDAEKLLKLIDALENNDDVQKVHGNYDIPDEIIEKLAS